MRRAAPLLLALPVTLLVRAAVRGQDERADRPGPAAPAAPVDSSFDPGAFFGRWCRECHVPPGGETDLRALLSLETARGAPDLLRAARERLAEGDMPPDDAPRPDPAARQAALRWLSALAPPAPPRVALRRLNRAEYDRCVQDLLGVTCRPGRDFPRDDVGHGFDTVGDVLGLSPLLLEKLTAAAEEVAGEAVLVWKPLALRVKGADLDGAKRERRGQGWLYSEGAMLADVVVPVAGEYALRVRACGDQAGPDPVRIGYRVGRRVAARADVAAPRSAAQVYEARLTLPAGQTRLGVAFLNDYYRPEDPDPTQRDRNLGVEWLEVEGPLSPPTLPAFHARVLGQFPAAGADPRPAARAILAPLVRRAWRGQVRPGDLDRLAGLVAASVEGGADFARGLQVALQAVLLSPRFLFRLELDPRPDDPTPHPISELELAARISFFLWSSLPDDELLDLAEAGRLRAELPRQVRRLLDDPRASALTEEFAGQWLQLRRLDEVTPDPGTYPDFDEELRAAMRAETELLFEAVLREDRSALDLVAAPFTFVNERLARHYGIAGIEGARFRRVAAPPGRAGLLGHASLLTLTSNPTRTSPVKRGKFVLEALLDQPPPPPPPGAGDLPDSQQDSAAASLRERLQRHRREASCASCHARMDALGLGLERFDGVGAWRERDEGGFPIDDRAALPDGSEVRGPDGLREHLRARARQVVRALLGKLLVYGVGRGLSPSDGPALDAIARELEADPTPWRFQALLVKLIGSEPFQARRGELEEAR